MVVLSGMKAICQYCNRSEPTLIKMIQEYEDFPAVKIGGIWESSTVKIDKWRHAQIDNGISAKKAKKSSPRKAVNRKKQKIA